MTGIRSVFLDLDDTLVAFDAVTEPSWREVCGWYCAGKPGLDPAILYGRIQERSTQYWSDPERHRAGRLDIVAARALITGEVFAGLGLPARDAEEVALRYSRLRLEKMFLLPGARETLESLVSNGFVMALLTNGDSETQRDKIRRFDLERYFRAILIEGELGYGKPDPRVYRTALSALGASPGNTVMVGDNPEWDVKAAQHEGIRAVWIDRKGCGETGAPDIVPDWRISGIAELPGVLGFDVTAARAPR
jgi:putative hydrolase of the HAD superfamily